MPNVAAVAGTYDPICAMMHINATCRIATETKVKNQQAINSTFNTCLI